jgi:hypothetical protein
VETEIFISTAHIQNLVKIYDTIGRQRRREDKGRDSTVASVAPHQKTK